MISVIADWETGAACDGPTAEAVTRFTQPHWVDVLHVGCGAYDRDKLPPVFRGKGWREMRLDIDPAVSPDFVASITDMEIISDGAIDAVFDESSVSELFKGDNV